MLQFTVNMRRKSPGFEVKAILSVSSLRGADEKSQDDMKNMRLKLEQLIPRTYPVKYNITSKEMVISVKTKTASEAHHIQSKLNDLIKAAAKTLGIH